MTQVNEHSVQKQELSDGRVVWSVDVGDMSTTKVVEYLNNIKQTIAVKPASSD